MLYLTAPATASFQHPNPPRPLVGLLGVHVGGAVRVNCCWQHLLSVGGGAVVCGAERRNRVLYWLLTGRLVDVADHLERRRARALDAIRHAGREISTGVVGRGPDRLIPGVTERGPALRPPAERDADFAGHLGLLQHGEDQQAHRGRDQGGDNDRDPGDWTSQSSPHGPPVRRIIPSTEGAFPGSVRISTGQRNTAIYL